MCDRLACFVRLQSVPILADNAGSLVAILAAALAGCAVIERDIKPIAFVANAAAIAHRIGYPHAVGTVEKTPLTLGHRVTRIQVITWLTIQANLLTFGCQTRSLTMVESLLLTCSDKHRSEKDSKGCCNHITQLF